MSEIWKSLAQNFEVRCDEQTFCGFVSHLLLKSMIIDLHRSLDSHLAILRLLSCFGQMALTRSKGKDVCKYESLKAMNTNTAKFASWIVKIRKPEAKPVIFMDKNHKEQQGSRSQCMLSQW